MWRDKEEVTHNRRTEEGRSRDEKLLQPCELMVGVSRMHQFDAEAGMIPFLKKLRVGVVAG